MSKLDTESLLDDLDDLSDVGEDDNNASNDEKRVGDEELDSRNYVDNNNKNDDDVIPEQDVSTSNQLIHNTVNDFLSPRLLHDKSFINHLQSIRKIMNNNGNGMAVTRKEESKEIRDIEHKLIVQSNKQLVNLANELVRVHGELCLDYKPKFPELEELVPNPIQFTRAIRVIGNEMDMTRVTDKLGEFLSSNQIITVSVAGSTTRGRPLSTDELDKVYASASYIEDIDATQQEIINFVESRMENLAPSICALVGSTTAAKLIGIAGGLSELAKIPSCNLQLLGQVKHSSSSRAGLSSSTLMPHQGIIIECDLVQNCPRSYHGKMVKLVAAKLALAARCDATAVETGRQRSAEHGIKFRQEIEQKFQKMQEPDKAQVLKALPKPDLTVKKRRGGKRMRRLQERYEETSMMKQANTRAFSTQAGEYGDDAMGLTLGLLDTAEVTAGGALRKNTGERKKMKFANTRQSRKRAAQMNAQAATSSKDNPLSDSTMLFTQARGMELVNPDAKKQKSGEGNQKWFSDTARFQATSK